MNITDLSAEQIRACLKTRAFAGEIHYLNEIDSTNLEADRLALAGSPEGTIVVADRQTRGKGRFGHQWFSPPGTGLYISLVLRPPLEPAASHYLVLLSGVACSRAIQDLCHVLVELKWPNDLQIRGKKIGGILLELSTDPKGLRHLIVGIGINVHTLRGEFPQDLRESAGSLLTETGVRVSRSELLCGLLSHFETRYFSSLAQGPSAILTEWTQLTNTLGRTLRVSYRGQVMEGTATGIDEDGGLLLRLPSGMTEKVLAGEVAVLD